MAKDKTDIWMPLYIGDYLAATSHLGALESGAYLHLLMHQWKNGSLPAESEALRRIARVDVDAWSNAWSIIQAFFEHSSGIPVQKRLERIREECQGRKAAFVAKAQAAAAKRWSKDAPSNASSNASSTPQAMPGTCPSSSSSSLKQNTNAPRFALPDWIDPTLWKSFEEMRMRLRKPMTDDGRKLAMKKLETLKQQGHSPKSVIENSVMNSYLGLFAPSQSSRVETIPQKRVYINQEAS